MTRITPTSRYRDSILSRDHVEALIAEGRKSGDSGRKSAESGRMATLPPRRRQGDIAHGWARCDE